MRGDVRFAGDPEFGFGAGSTVKWRRSRISPSLGAESGWAAFLLQRDYRDYFERRGISGLGLRPAGLRPAAGAFAGSERESSVRATDPWSLFRNSDRWRRNPLIDDGHYFIVGALAELDTRNDRDRPTTGWLIRGRFEHATSDDIAPVAFHRWFDRLHRPAEDMPPIGYCRRPALLTAHSRPPGQCESAGRWLDCG